MITLIVVDCQYDFISGSLAVEGATKAVSNIATFIRRNKKNIEKVVFTQDWHPYNHCSFERNGGKWPVHCLNHTMGASIDFSLIKTVEENNIPYSVLKKGSISSVEQYGAFTGGIARTNFLVAENTIINLNSVIVVCGIAGDYCVKETLKNLYSKGIVSLKLFIDGVASIDEGEAINAFIKSFGLETITLDEKLSNN